MRPVTDSMVCWFGPAAFGADGEAPGRLGCEAGLGLLFSMAEKLSEVRGKDEADFAGTPRKENHESTRVDTNSGNWVRVCFFVDSSLLRPWAGRFRENVDKRNLAALAKWRGFFEVSR